MMAGIHVEYTGRQQMMRTSHFPWNQCLGKVHEVDNKMLLSLRIHAQFGVLQFVMD